MTNAVSTDRLERTFGPAQAVAPTTLEVAPGELFGLIGPDGAGKTTLLRMLVTVLSPSGGRATVDGFDITRDYREIRARVGYMPGRFALYTDLSVEENLRFFASIFGTTVEANYGLIRHIYERLEPFRKRRAGALSGGMKQKLALSCALIHRPRVLFLDEPTTGVDAVSRLEFWDVLDGLKKEGLTILVSTPYMDEASRCDRIALMQDGRILAVDTPGGIRDSFDRPLLGVRTARRREVAAALRALEEVEAVHAFGEELHVTGGGADQLRSRLQALGLEAQVRPIRAGIEDVFMARMGEPQ